MKFTKQDCADLRDILCEIAGFDPSQEADPTGICTHVRRAVYVKTPANLINLIGHKLYRTYAGMLREGFGVWPGYSGDDGYPIPSGCTDMTPQEAYEEAYVNRTLWDEGTKYGRLRWELLEFLIEYFSELSK